MPSHERAAIVSHHVLGNQRRLSQRERLAWRYRALMGMESPEECLREAEECDRLAGLARSIATRQMLAVLASKWRALANTAAERLNQRHSGIQAHVIYEKPS
jgi:hypothetical protein